MVKTYSRWLNIPNKPQPDKDRAGFPSVSADWGIGELYRLTFWRRGLKKKLIPVKKVYEDGGTQTYTALTYKVIVWKQIDGKTGTEFYIFPNNFHQLDYYE